MNYHSVEKGGLGMKSTGKMAASATLHCLTGCAIGELAGLTIGHVIGLATHEIIILAAGMSFVSGYGVSTVPLLRVGLKFWPALKLVLVADTLSIVTMTIVDNIIMVTVPGAMGIDPLRLVYWTSRVLSLSAAFIVAWPVNYWLLAHGKGHALTHKYMGHHEHDVSVGVSDHSQHHHAE